MEKMIRGVVKIKREGRMKKEKKDEVERGSIEKEVKQ